ncbi:MAG: TetR/AcrR family transcriptional regulator [Thermomicrobiales bacterium]
MTVASKPPQPTRRYPPETRRAMILDAAGAYIAEHGLDGATAREIADRCGISTGALTHHFPTMDGLLAEALRFASSRFTEEHLQRLETKAGALERLHLFIDSCLPDKPRAFAMWRLWLEYWAHAARNPGLATVHTERHRVLRAAVERVIAEGVRRGEFRPVDASAVAIEFIGLLDGLGLQAAIRDEEVGVETARALLHGMLAARLLPPAEG